MIHLRKNYGKFENRLNYTEIVVLESKKRKHSEFMNKLKLRMILWSTAEAVLRQNCYNCKYSLHIDPMVYCGSGTETLCHNDNKLKNMILWSTAEAVLRRFSNNHPYI